MGSILGDKTIASLLDIIEMEPEKKQEIRDFLPSMDEKDRQDILESLLNLFSLQVQKEVTLKQGEMIAQSGQSPDSFDWQKFSNVEDEVLKNIIGKAQNQ